MKNFRLSLAPAALSFFLSLSPSEEIKKSSCVEWNSTDYEKGNIVQSTAFCHFLEKNNISFDNKKVLSIGCGTGKIESLLAPSVEHIHGIDPSSDMISFAKDNYKAPNLSFYEAAAENYKVHQPYNAAFASFSFHWFQDKPQALKCISSNLESGSSFFFNAITSDDPKPLNLSVAEKVMATLPHIDPTLKNSFIQNPTAAIGSSYPSRDELQRMLIDAGFKIIICEPQTYTVLLKDRRAVEDFQRPIVMSRPIIQSMPKALREKLFVHFIDEIIKCMKQTDEQGYLNEFTNTIVLAQKK
jgi:ubiquinone/menaquinone biosynthesis C-methylase UbiE